MSKSNRRFYRTLLIGLAALGVLVWAAIDQFGISYQEIGGLFLGTLWVALGVILIAAPFTVCWIGLRRLLQRGDGE